MNHTIGIALLGAGMVADYHRQATLNNADLGARLVAVGHYQPEQFSTIAAKFGAPCMNYGAVLARADVDVVAICTPSGQHAEQSIAALKAGKHVIVEKPMALSLADADAMIAAAAQANRHLVVCLQRRTDPTFRRVHDAIVAGDLGSMTLATIHMPYLRGDAYYAQAAWRGSWALDGGGVLINQGIHIVDQLVWNMGDPVEVKAQAATLHRQIEVEDTVAATLRFANGALGMITATTTAAPGFPHFIGFYGTGGGIQMEGETVTSWRLTDPEQAKVTPVESQARGQVGTSADPRGMAAIGHTAVMRDLILAIREGRSPEIDGKEGRRSLATILAIYQSAGILA